MVLGVAATLGMGCASSKVASVPPSGRATAATPPNAKEVTCAEIEGCYDSAKAPCGGEWRQVSKPGEPFPYAELGADKRYRMLVVCGEAK